MKLYPCGITFILFLTASLIWKNCLAQENELSQPATDGDSQQQVQPLNNTTPVNPAPEESEEAVDPALEFLIRTAYRYFQDGELEKADEIFKKILAIEPENKRI